MLCAYMPEYVVHVDVHGCMLVMGKNNGGHMSMTKTKR